jgi:Na+/H+ antiporter NhaD/arsenite permease-like protein
MPAEVLPLFFAMCFGGTLGGNASILGASSNIVAIGICAQNGVRVSFMAFLRYGIPVAAVQLASGGYLWVRFL